MTSKVNPLKIQTDNVPKGVGTTTKDGLEIVPYTKTGLLKTGLEEVGLLKMPEPITDTKTDLSKLREYQKEDVLLLSNRAVSAVLSEMRTGKTPTALSIFKTRGISKFVIVCPTSITYQWAEEVKRWCGLETHVPKGNPTARGKLYRGWDKDVLIIGYELLRRDADIILKTNKDIEGIIVDEAHRIKNHKSQQYLAVKKFSKIRNRIALTGTPAPNKQHELFGMMSFLFPTLFPSYWRFLEYYFETEQQKNWKNNTSYTEIGELKHPTELQEFLERIAIRRTQKEVMPWLPERDYVKIKLDLTKDQKRYIDELMDMFETEDVIVDSILTRLMRIRQICNHPALIELKGKSPKLEWIKEFRKDYPEKSIVIFSNFTSFLTIVAEELEENNLIIGKTDKNRRNMLKNAFQNGKIKTLLVNVKAGKEGLTLDKADVAIFCDNYPPAADIEQAEHRITATTEDRAEKENTIYQLMMKDSYDEQLYDLVKTNKSTTDVINDFKNYLKNRENK